jgi:hypothetical protein
LSRSSLPVSELVLCALLDVWFSPTAMKSLPSGPKCSDPPLW